MLSALLLGEGLDIGDIDLAGVLEVSLVAGYHEYDVFGAVLLEFLHPLFDLLEALLGGDVVHDDGSRGVLIVERGHGVELFLSGSVLRPVLHTQMASWMFSPRSNSIFFSRKEALIVLFCWASNSPWMYLRAMEVLPTRPSLVRGYLRPRPPLCTCSA